MSKRERNKANLEAINNAFNQYVDKSLTFAQQQMAPEPIRLDPSKFRTDFPVERPDVPEIVEQLPPEAHDGSIISSFASFMDNIWPDDAGGLIRGTSGWMSNIPGYRQTVGAALGVPLSAAESAINAMNWGSEQMNHLGAALMSALPGGIQTLDWEQAQDISLGQVVAANAAINSRNGFVGALINVATAAPFAALNAVGQSLDPENILYSKDFDILNEEDRKAAFESGGMGTFTSGFADAIWLVAADPTILGGKATSILRLGTKGGEFGGYTNQALKNSNQINAFARTLDDQAELIATLGVDGARSSGRLTAEGENLIAAMQNNADQLVNHPWVKSSPSKRDTTALLAATSTDDPITAAAVAGAMAGDVASWNTLRNRSADFYDATARAFGVDVFAPLGAAADDFATAGVRLTDDAIRFGDDLIYERLGEFPELLVAGQMITRGGSRISPRTVRAANAWRAGATRNQFNNNAFKKSPLSETSKRGHFVYDTIEGISGSRPLEVVRWLGKGTPNGIVNVKDGADGAASLSEVTAWLRKTPLSQERAARYLNEFAAARTVNDRTALLRVMEEDVFSAIAAQNDITPGMARVLYEGYSSRRAAALENVRRSETKFYYDPDTSKAVKVPDFYAELDQAYPLLDVRHVREVIKDNSWMKARDDILGAGDYLNSLWKVSVLLRLGYTQRNFADNVLRSFATIGLITANPKAFMRLPGNAIYYAKARRGMKNMQVQEKRLLDTYEDLNGAREILSATLRDARFDDMEKIGAKMGQTLTKINKLERSMPAFAGARHREKVQREIAKLKEEYRSLKSQHDNIKINYYDPLLPEIREARFFEEFILQEIDDLSSKVIEATRLARAANEKRVLTGRRPNIMRDGTEMPGAFQGQEGAIALLASSADRTTYATFNAAAGRRIQQLENSADFRKLDPNKLEPGQMQVYFDEYALRINRRYREDIVGRMVLENRPVEEIRAFLTSPNARAYREQLSVTGRRILTEQDVDEYIFHVMRRLDNEMPKNTRLRELALDHELTSGEVAAALRGRDLPILPGRLEDGVSTSNIFAKAKGKVDSFTQVAMRKLGTTPENKLLRHPFYSNVFNSEQRRLYNIALDQGVDVMSPAVQRSINRSAHQGALKATRETMYTIERLSNAAQLLRFISPFFPAWENAVRTWGRIAWTNPAVAGYGNLLWNIPNNMGLVVNEFGEPVERSNMLRDEGYWIVWPEAVTNFLAKDLGPFNRFTPGEDLRTRQNSFNVIFPGAEWWFSGLGPAATIPTSWFLRGKPEDAEVLRNAVGDELYRQMVPSGNAQGDLFDLLTPTFVRRFRLLLNGTDFDSAYVTTYNQIVEDEYIKAQLEDRTLTEKDIKRAHEKAQRFWEWQLGAAAVLPVQSARMSPFQPQRDYWRKLIDDNSLTYDQKIEKLQEKFPDFGDALLTITRSTSYTETKLQPNLTTWQRVTKNPEYVDELYRINPELVGMFANMGSYDDPWSYAVYSEFGDLKLGPGKVPVRRKLTAQEINDRNEVIDGARTFRAIKDYVEEKAIQAGFSSLQVKDAAELKAVLDRAEVEVGERYPGWKTERQMYFDKLPMFLMGARSLIGKADLLNEDSTIANLATYMEIRDDIAERISQTNDSNLKEELRQIGYAAAFELRQKDIGFADFYDQYLYRDDFRRIK